MIVYVAPCIIVTKQLFLITAAQRAFLSARLACARTHLALASTLKEIESNRFATMLLGEAVLPMALSFGRRSIQCAILRKGRVCSTALSDTLCISEASLADRPHSDTYEIE